MGQTKWGTPLPRFFQILVLTCLLYFSVTNQVTKQVNDRVVLSCNYNISADELTRVRIYWQKSTDVVLTVISGKVDLGSKYKNRTIPNIINDPSIVILGLRPSDSGTYTCVIQKPEKGAFVLEHLISVLLFVKADFPAPSITELGNPSTHIKRIICSTSGGFPKPHLSWLENGKEINAINTTVSQDPETELYTISSELDFNVTKNHSFSCFVKYGNLTVSQTFKWQKSEPPPPPSNPFWIWILISVFGSIIFVTVFVCCTCKRFSAKRRRNEESIEMERISPVYSGSIEASG
ncbi:PREDICTED: T-lymphocyte activation antigen CD80 [Miniopterus natalensis]|uniref:T-lymphocyte activation antigen CD80 n=1 Tax=Miniopterus natalensis TaxID=291302 RepID=UPI0007A6F971|nr:PREDICTED: T-lymphocyte activation antigen CD80 [Miniopterus natalensis]